MLEQRHLQAFVAVASLGSVSRAAAQLGYSQPAVTQQIRHMERVLGVQLFDRDSLPIQLTAEGRERLLVAEAMVLLGQRLVARQETRSEVRSEARNKTGNDGSYSERK